MSALANKRALILGVANERSIAWAIARALAEGGARLGLTWVGESIERRVRPLAAEIGAELVLPCDVSDDAQIDALFAEVDRAWGGLDVLVHAVAYAEREDLVGRFVDTSRAGFHTALDVSAYSLVGLARGALPLLRKAGGGSIVTLTFDGSRRVFPNYNVMGVAKAALESSVRYLAADYGPQGIRVNAISAGPMRTLVLRPAGAGRFPGLLFHSEIFQNTGPICRTAAYLAADLGPEGVRVNAVSAGPIKTLSAAGIRDFRQMLHVVEERAPLRRNVTADEVASLVALLAGKGGEAITGQVLHVDAGLSILGV